MSELDLLYVLKERAPISMQDLEKPETFLAAVNRGPEKTVTKRFFGFLTSSSTFELHQGLAESKFFRWAPQRELDSLQALGLIEVTGQGATAMVAATAKGQAMFKAMEPHLPGHLYSSRDFDSTCRTAELTLLQEIVTSGPDVDALKTASSLDEKSFASTIDRMFHSRLIGLSVGKNGSRIVLEDSARDLADVLASGHRKPVRSHLRKLRHGVAALVHRS